MAGVRRLPDDRLRAAQQLGDRHGGIPGQRHEGRVGTVFKQTANEIGQQILMAADRRIGTAGDMVVPCTVEQGFVQILAHAMQALKLEAGAVPARPLQNAGDRERIMGGKLREQLRAGIQQFLRAGHIIEVGHRLAGENGIVGQATLLRPLDLGVPIGTLDQPHHEAAPVRAGQFGDMVDHCARPLLVGLDGQPKPVPAGQRGIGDHRVNHRQRQFQPVRLLGIDGEIEVERLGFLRQRHHLRHQLAQHPRLRHRLVTRVQGRKLDGYARSVRQRCIAGRPSDGLDSVGIGF